MMVARGPATNPMARSLSFARFSSISSSSPESSYAPRDCAGASGSAGFKVALRSRSTRRAFDCPLFRRGNLRSKLCHGLSLGGGAYSTSWRAAGIRPRYCATYWKSPAGKGHGAALTHH